ncbi:Rho GTPase activation protein [Imleria badia]|nr:Rho GTPase activation protein [Imleria badia]
MPPNLKQRLAALSLAPSSPTSPLSAANLKKPFQHPWKRGFPGPTAPEPDARDRVCEIMAKVIFQAGVDYETRPMVIISASALPDPRQVSYDILVSRILSYLDLYVESDYTVVFFAAGGRHAPSWNWVWKAYRSLNRKYRKNLKRLYIVHSSFFTKMLFSLAGAIISPKFFRKIVYIDTLSDLAHHVPLTQIDIPPAVYQENMKHERQINMPIPIRASVFGVPLEDLMGCDGERGGIPRVIKDSIQYIRESGMKEEGIFRRSPNSGLLKQVQQAYDRGQVVSLDTFDDPYLASVLIKKYLRDLPIPPFPESLYPVVRQCPVVSSDLSDMSAVTYIRDTLLPQLMPCVYILLSHVLHLLHEVSLHSSSNRMDAHNLAIVVCPNLVKGSNPLRDVMMCGGPGGPALASDSPLLSTSTTTLSKSDSSFEGSTTLGAIIKLCIQRYYEIFDEIKDRSEPVSSIRQLSRSPSPPSSDCSGSVSKPPRPLSLSVDDEESIDDAMLVMPIGPAGNGGPSWHSSTREGRTPNTTGTSGTQNAGSPIFPYQPRQRKAPITGAAAGVRSVNNEHNGTTSPFASRSRARSTLSIEKIGNGLGSGRGSISIGRGTSRKASGSGVEAMGITAGGFFTPSMPSPPLPPLTGSSS